MNTRPPARCNARARFRALLGVTGGFMDFHDACVDAKREAAALVETDEAGRPLNRKRWT